MNHPVPKPRRLYAAELTGRVVVLSPEEAHHVLHVLRLTVGEEVELFDGKGASAVARIAEVKHGAVEVAVARLHPPEPRMTPAVHLAFAVPQGKRLNWLLEKATELGAASLRPVVFARSVAGRQELSAGKHGRWHAHCVAAAKQCGLNFLPAIVPPAGVQEALAGAAGAFGLVGEPAEDAAGILAALTGRQDRQEIFLLVGPEGGITEQERGVIRQAGFIPVRLGRTTLRIETAAVALLAATMAACGAAKE